MTSARAARRRNASRPRGAFRSRTRDSLLRFSRTKGELSPSRNGPVARTGSPPAGFSTLITRAPRSASCIVANGAAMKAPTSRTVTPDNGVDDSTRIAATSMSSGARLRTIVYKTGRHVSKGMMPTPRARSGQGEDLRSVARHEHGVLELGGASTILGDDGPAVVPDVVVDRAEGDHRLDRERHPGFEHGVHARLVVVQHHEPGVERADDP